MKQVKNPDVIRILETADQLGEVELRMGNKSYRVLADEFLQNPVKGNGSPFAKVKPIPVKMTGKELSDLIVEMRGE